MDILDLLKAFLLSIVAKINQLLRKAAPLLTPAPPPATPPIAFDNEETPAGPYNPRPPAAPVANNHFNLDWAMIVIGFCLPSAVEIAIESLQIKSQLPPMFHFLCLAIILSFTFLFVSKFMSSKFPIVAQALERFGVSCAVTAIFVAITIPLPLWLKCVTWTIYAISFLTVIFCIFSNT